MRKGFAAKAVCWFAGLIGAAAIAFTFDQVAHYDWGLSNKLIRQDALTLTGLLAATLVLKLFFPRPSG